MSTLPLSSTLLWSVVLMVSLLARTSNAGGASTCSSEIVWVEEGPYFVDGQAAVSNVVYNQTGLPLNITMTVLDGRNSSTQQCIPLANVKVDIWNCNWDGVYSDESSENTLGVIYLRGYQLSNSTGGVMFQTVYPGWYSGRTPHVHFRFRVYDGTNSSLSYDETLQVFFDDEVTDFIYAHISPYTLHTGRTTYNNDSNVYTADNQLVLTGSYTSGYQSMLHVTIPLGGSASNYILGSATNTGNGAAEAAQDAGQSSSSSGAATSSSSSSAQASSAGRGVDDRFLSVMWPLLVLYLAQGVAHYLRAAA